MEIMAALRNSLKPVEVFKRFRYAGESWAVTESPGPFDKYSITHLETGAGTGSEANSIEDVMSKFKDTIKKEGLAKLRKGIARARRERKFLDRKDKIRDKALSKLTYWEKRALDLVD